jgi:acetyl esterase
MAVDPGAQAVLDFLAEADSPPLEEVGPVEARRMYASLGAIRGHDGAEVASVVERMVAGVPCQVITPLTVEAGVLVWFHGGGWTVGSATEASATCRDLAAAAGCVVVNVDYRLAPEHPWPAAIDDAESVTRWVLEHAAEIGGDPSRVAVGGDSAGGNLAAVTALEVPGLVHQLLVYPGVDLTMSHPSIEENGEGYLLTRDTMRWFTDNYVGDGDPRHPRLSPLYAESLAGAAPAHVITAGFDPLRDEGQAYVDRLREAGVRVHHDLVDDQIHGCFTMYPIIPAAADLVAVAAAHLRDAFEAA